MWGREQSLIFGDKSINKAPILADGREETMKEDGFIPAQLSFFSIYSPPLGPTDETFGDQIVFHYSRTAKEGKAQGRAKTDEEKEVENEKLRQIGLAQGMVGFARNFSDDQPIDSVETEKSRILMHELEKDWWVLAVRIPLLPFQVMSNVSSCFSQSISLVYRHQTKSKNTNTRRAKLALHHFSYSRS